MRILHTSDWHLGARLGSQDRLDDTFARLQELCDYIDREQVDLLLVAGDVFDEHRAEALARIVGRLGKLLTPRIEAGLTCVFVAGNHDREHVFPLLSGLQELVAPDHEQRVVFADRPRMLPVTSRSGEAAQLMLLPYPTPIRYALADQRWPSPEEKRKTLAAAVRASIQELGRDATKGVPVVLCGHFLVRGVKEGMYQLSEQEDVPVEPSDLPSYAYIALGHIHKPQQVGAHYIRYCGSLDRMDRGEARDAKQALLVELSKTGLRDIRELPLNATPFRHIEASSEEELERAAESMSEPERTLVSLTLKLRREQRLSPLLARARQLFPRLYAPPDIRWQDARSPERAQFAHDRRDVRGTVRSYLQQTLTDDKEAGALVALAEELLAEVDASSERAEAPTA
ncbi:MAG: exonuclease SbcCD subunit D [Dehalococcoidia bacterium]